MNMNFDYTKLNKSDQKIYDAMNDTEKKKYESIWVQIESLKEKQMQQKNASKERAAREKKAMAEKERKDRNHRLIERGSILESLIINSTDFTNEEIKRILEKALGTDSTTMYIEEIRNTHNAILETAKSFF
ncbi:MAG: DUF3847 domain-containing protein [Lachnospiraceae bacterium]|nr:DUF3847 domain-containing protein [Lachnospiraceae bacterium]